MQVRRYDDVWIEGTGSYLPARRETTTALFGEAAADLITLTGVESRHVAADDEATSDLLCHALRPLTEAPDGSARPVDRLIVATVTPDHPSPGTAPLVAHRLGLGGPPAYDLTAACAGAIFALDDAARAIATGDRRVLVGAAECRFRTLQGAPPGVRVLFGDGAGALSVVGLGSATPPRYPPLRLVATALSSDGSGYDAIKVPAGGSRMQTTPETIASGLNALTMEDGAHVFFKAVDGFTSIAADFLAAAGLSAADIDLVVPHQPNLRILERVSRRLRIPLERFQLEVPHIGNVGGASVLIALDRALRAGRIQPGQRVLLLTAGAGYTAGVALLQATDKVTP